MVPLETERPTLRRLRELDFDAYADMIDSASLQTVT